MTKRTIKSDKTDDNTLEKTTLALRAMNESWANNRTVALTMLVYMKIQENGDITLNEILEYKKQIYA